MSFAGSFLVAQASLTDPNFAQSVVLLLAHSADGAFGLVINRPVHKPGLPFPVFQGGPCSSPGFFMLHGHADWLEDESADGEESAQREVAPGVYLGDPAALQRATQPE